MTSDWNSLNVYKKYFVVNGRRAWVVVWVFVWTLSGAPLLPLFINLVWEFRPVPAAVVCLFRANFSPRAPSRSPATCFLFLFSRSLSLFTSPPVSFFHVIIMKHRTEPHYKELGGLFYISSTSISRYTSLFDKLIYICQTWRWLRIHRPQWRNKLTLGSPCFHTKPHTSCIYCSFF